MDHQYRAGANASVEGFEDKYYIGRRPNGIYIPRFRNVGKDKRTDYVRGLVIKAAQADQVGGVALKKCPLVRS